MEKRDLPDLEKLTEVDSETPNVIKIKNIASPEVA